MAVKGITLELGDGNEYVIAPLTLGALEDLQERLDSFQGGTDAESIKTMIDAAHASLKRNYPDMVRGTVRDLLDVANMQSVFMACMNVSGMVERPSGGIEPAGEARPAGRKPRRG